MSGYEKHVFQGVLAGLVTGLLIAVLGTVLIPPEMLEDLTEEVVRKQIPPDTPPEEVEKALENLRRTVKSVYWIAPLSSLFQYILLGAVFGLVKGVFRERFKLSETLSAVSTGALYFTLIGLLPLLVLSLFVNLLRYPTLTGLIVIPPILYTILMVLFTTRKGPWTRMIEAKPEMT